jgi:hypothetical protein
MYYFTRNPAISLQGTSGYSAFREFGKFFVASPIISRARTTAYIVFVSLENSSKSNPSIKFLCFQLSRVCLLKNL